MRSSNLFALAASLSSVSAVYQGFNYGSTKEDGYTFRVQSDYQSLFSTAKNLVGTSGFTSARLYTTIQGGTASDPTSAIPAAIAESTTLLLGFWASAGQTSITNEITALKTAISLYGSSFTSLVAGISVGSEDLYRISPMGVAADSGLGAEPAAIASYISQVRSAIAGTGLSGVPVGHVDTWTAWVNGSNSAVIDACDFIGMDAYPYFQSTMANGIENGASLFNSALQQTQAAVGGKDVWITETGFPVSGSVSGSATPSLANAKTYWDAVGCPNFGKTNIWWFTLEDTDNATPNPSFGITSGNPMSTTPLFDLSCADVSSASSSSSATASNTASGGGSSGTATKGSGTSSSATGVATTLVTSGGGLSPSQGNGIGSGTVTTTGSSATATGASGNRTTASGTSKGSGSGSSGTTTGALASATANGASVLSGPAVAAMAALVVAAAAL